MVMSRSMSLIAMTTRQAIYLLWSFSLDLSAPILYFSESNFHFLISLLQRQCDSVLC